MSSAPICKVPEGLSVLNTAIVKCRFTFQSLTNPLTDNETDTDVGL